MVFDDIVLVKDIKELTSRYLKKNFVIDFINILPLYYIDPVLKVIKLVKLLRLGTYFGRLQRLITNF